MTDTKPAAKPVAKPVATLTATVNTLATGGAGSLLTKGAIAVVNGASFTVPHDGLYWGAKANAGWPCLAGATRATEGRITAAGPLGATVGAVCTVLVVARTASSGRIGQGSRDGCYTAYPYSAAMFTFDGQAK